MCEGTKEFIKGSSVREEFVEDGHRVIHTFKVFRLDSIQRTYFPYSYQTKCPTTPTLWDIGMKYEQVQDSGNHTFSVVAKRLDHSGHRVKGSVDVVFYDFSDEPVLSPIHKVRDRMAYEDQCTATLQDIPPKTLSEVTTVEVCLTVELCHKGTLDDTEPIRFASKTDTRKTSIISSKL